MLARWDRVLPLVKNKMGKSDCVNDKIFFLNYTIEVSAISKLYFLIKMKVIKVTAEKD